MTLERKINIDEVNMRLENKLDKQASGLLGQRVTKQDLETSLGQKADIQEVAQIVQSLEQSFRNLQTEQEQAVSGSTDEKIMKLQQL